LYKLRQDGIVDANVGHGRYTYASYVLSEAYLASITETELQVAAGAEDIFLIGNLIGHTANSPLKGTVPTLPFGDTS
jgi:hypothetical protein